MKQKRVAIVEIGGSHDECILSQVMGLKAQGAWVVFCGSTEMFNKNSLFKSFFDSFHEVVLPRTFWGDFKCMRNLNSWFKQNNIDAVVCNTAQGGHIRNLTLTAPKSIPFYGILHTTKMLEESSTQKIISRKINTYFLLNDTLVKKVGKKRGLSIHSFYPLNYPHFDLAVEKDVEIIHLGVTGGVENRRKDLVGCIELLKQMPENIHLYFLGKSDRNSVEVQSFLTALNEEGLKDKVTMFDRFISEEEMDGYLKILDGILPLVHPNTSSAQEYFNRQISGAINSAFAYKIPMLIHEVYTEWEDFQRGVVFYNLENFKDQFLTFQQSILILKDELCQNPKFSSTFQNQYFAQIVLS